MSNHPPLPPHARLDAEERALAALLPRAHGRGEPSAALDARILAAAAAALQPQKQRRPRRSWIAPISVTASLVLAVGLAWQLRPPPVPATHQQTAASAESDAMAGLAIEAPPASPSVSMPITEPRPVAARPIPVMTPPTESAPAARSSSPAATPAQAGNAATADAAFAAALPAPPPPPPPAPVVVGEMAAEQVAAPQATESARAAAPAMAKSRASEAVRQRSEAAANSTGTQAADAAQRSAADATTLDTVTLADEPGEEVPPATADSPEVRDAWLRRIGELLEQGKTEEAKASLAEFKRRYPDATLPPELRKLEP